MRNEMNNYRNAPNTMQDDNHCIDHRGCNRQNLNNTNSWKPFHQDQSVKNT